MLRKLGTFERAMLVTNRHAPFNIISVLRMESAPSPEKVKWALSFLQRRHPLLGARIVGGKGRPFFESLPSGNVSFTLIERRDDGQWRGVAESEMAFGHDSAAGPLFRAIYLYRDGYGDLVLNVHHAIMDAVSGVNLLEELLRLCSGETQDLPVLETPPLLEERFPPPYRGIRRLFPLAGYTYNQMKDMLRYLWRNRGKRMPPVIQGGRVHSASLILPEDLVTSLARRGRQAGLTLNSLLNAALMLATNRHLYRGKPVIMRTFTFADMRPQVQPPLPPENLANYISMLGLTLEVDGDQDFWDLSKTLHEKIYRVLKSGDKYNASFMSENLLKGITRYKFMRFGATALSYSGAVPLARRYGQIQVTGLHGFVSGYDLGPEIGSQARQFQDQLWWDFIYLDSDMDADLAGKIMSEIQSILESASQGPD